MLEPNTIISTGKKPLGDVPRPKVETIWLLRKMLYPLLDSLPRSFFCSLRIFQPSLFGDNNNAFFFVTLHPPIVHSFCTSIFRLFWPTRSWFFVYTPEASLFIRNLQALWIATYTCGCSNQAISRRLKQPVWALIEQTSRRAFWLEMSRGLIFMNPLHPLPPDNEFLKFSHRSRLFPRSTSCNSRSLSPQYMRRRSIGASEIPSNCIHVQENIGKGRLIWVGFWAEKGSFKWRNDWSWWQLL